MDKITFCYNIFTIFKDSSLFWKILVIIFFLIAIFVIIYYIIGLNKISQENFYIHSRIVIKTSTPKAPTPIVCLLNNNSLKLIDVAVLVEVINKKPMLSKVQSYRAEVKIDEVWVKMDTISSYGLNKFFWIQNSNLRSSKSIDFKDGIFDELARNKMLRQGEILSGWIFFTLPKEAREIPGRIGKIKFYVENSLNEIQKIFLEPKIASQGESQLGYGELLVGDIVDLSNYKYK